MKKFIYLLTLSLGLMHTIQTARVLVTRQKRTVADIVAFESMLDVIKNSWLSKEARYKKVAALLQEYPHIINAKNYYGSTALMLAVSYGHTEIVKLLFAAGADVNAHTTDYGWTALMYAARGNGYTEIVKLLITAGADIYVQNDKDGNIIVRDYAHDKDAYDEAVREGLRIRKLRKAQYEKDQAAAKNIILEEVTHIAPLVDNISGYAYDPKNTDDLPETSAAAASKKKSWCVVQ